MVTDFRIYIETTVIADWLLVETATKRQRKKLTERVLTSHELVNFLLQQTDERVQPLTSYWALFEAVDVIKKAYIQTRMVLDGIPTKLYSELKDSNEYRIDAFQRTKITRLIEKLIKKSKRTVTPLEPLTETADIKMGIPLILNKNLEGPDSFIMLLARRDVLQNKIKAYRRIVYPDENKLIEGFCLNCKRNTWFYRTKSDMDTRLSKLLHCSECHFVEWEHTLLNNLDTKPKTTYQEYVMSKQGLRSFMADMEKYAGPSRIQTYYHKHEPQFEFKLMEEFFIRMEFKGKLGFMCPACRYIYQRKKMAEIHFNHFWEHMNDGWIRGCMIGVKRQELQQMELMA